MGRVGRHSHAVGSVAVLVRRVLRVSSALDHGRHWRRAARRQRRRRVRHERADTDCLALLCIAADHCLVRCVGPAHSGREDSRLAPACSN